MYAFAKVAEPYEAMVRVFTDTGMRLGEVLPLRRENLRRRTPESQKDVHEGTILDYTKTDHGAGRIAPVPATLAWMIKPIKVPADVIVVSRDYWDRWRDVRGGLVHAALSHGRVVAG